MEVLGVQDVVVCGHSHCGAVGALVRGDDLDGVPAVRDWLAHAADEPGTADPDDPTVMRAVQNHVLAQLLRLRSYPCVEKRLADGQAAGARLVLRGAHRCRTRAPCRHRRFRGPVSAATDQKPAGRIARFPHLKQDFAASLVVFLVALPLCVGVAVASGVPAELGLVTGIVGGLVTGLLRGSSLQVSGPAAGLTVLVFEAVQEFGLPALGVIVLATGALQLAMGALKLGRYFRAISVSVVEGMLAGIGLVLIAGQLYAMAGAKAPSSGLGKIAGLPGAVVDAVGSTSALASLAIGSRHHRGARVVEAVRRRRCVRCPDRSPRWAWPHSPPCC